MAPNGHSVHTNGHSVRRPEPGVFVPLLTFFKPVSEGEGVDVETTVKHAVDMARTGLGLVLLGTMGEASHLTHSERTSLIRAVTTAVREAGLSVPIVAGTGAGSTRETIELCVEAAEAGADQVMVIPPGYYAGAMDKVALKQLFFDVAEASPIPVFVYNFPGAAAGIDMDSDLIAEIASHPNIVGCKLTCGSVGKLTRLTSIPGFNVLGGFSDFLLSGMYMNSAGCITGLANISPKSIVRLYSLINKALASSSPEDLKKAQNLQFIVSKSDYILAKVGITGMKALLIELHGYGGYARRPLRPWTGDVAALKEEIKDLLELEASL